jgi:hypothetical protein
LTPEVEEEIDLLPRVVSLDDQRNGQSDEENVENEDREDHKSSSKLGDHCGVVEAKRRKERGKWGRGQRREVDVLCMNLRTEYFCFRAFSLATEVEVERMREGGKERERYLQHVHDEEMNQLDTFLRIRGISQLLVFELSFLGSLSNLREDGSLDRDPSLKTIPTRCISRILIFWESSCEGTQAKRSEADNEDGEGQGRRRRDNRREGGGKGEHTSRILRRGFSFLRWDESVGVGVDAWSDVWR